MPSSDAQLVTAGTHSVALHISGRDTTGPQGALRLRHHPGAVRGHNRLIGPATRLVAGRIEPGRLGGW